MRLVTFESPLRHSRIGAVTADGRIVDLNSACALHLNEQRQGGAYQPLADALVPANMRALFAGGDTSLNAAREALDFALQQSSHASGPHEEPVIYPEHLTQELDYELELAVVLKKSGKHFTPEEAASHLGGYVIFNDITARDIQRREMKSGVFSFCKGIDTFCPLGPWIVTADEIPDAHNLAMELRVNGEARQRSHSSKMSVKIPEILSHYSPMGYSAGDVVSTGPVSARPPFSGDPQPCYLRPRPSCEYA